MKRIDLAYTAGIIDGEGYIGIEKRIRGKYSHYGLRVTVTSTDEWLPMWLRFAYGGRVSNSKQRTNVWQWGIGTRSAGAFLKSILPYLRLKRQQAEIAIQFQSRRGLYSPYGKPKEAFILDEANKILLSSMHSNKGKRKHKV